MPSPSEPINVANRKQLFIDDRFLESVKGASLKMNNPAQDAEPVIVPDKPWEPKGIAGYNTILFEDGRFRLWYGATMFRGLPREGAIRLGYAESDDGIHWTKPSLGLIEFQGSKDNNLVAPLLEKQSMQGGTIYRDERAPESHRYRLWTKFRVTNEQLEQGIGNGLWAMHSPDGIHWEYDDNQPTPGIMCDTQNMFFWDDRIEQYVGYTRVRETQHEDEAFEHRKGTGSYRSIGRITSPDFANWSNLDLVLQCDDRDLAIPVPSQRDDPRPNVDIYTSCAMKYSDAEDVYLMFPSFYYHWETEDFPATMDVRLYTSRDGIDWQAQGDRRPFLRKGIDGERSGGMIFANPYLIDCGNEFWFYYNGTAARHGDPTIAEHCGIFRSRIRKDGFVSLDADYDGGEMTTPLLTFTGTKLQLNVDCGAGGWLKVELQDEAGKPIDGYAQKDCNAVTGNRIDMPVTWSSNTDVSKLVGKLVRMRFVMRDVKLYAFEFAGS